MRPPAPSRHEEEELQLHQLLLLLLLTQLLSLGGGALVAAASLGDKARPLLLPSGWGAAADAAADTSLGWQGAGRGR